MVDYVRRMVRIEMIVLTAERRHVLKIAPRTASTWECDANRVIELLEKKMLLMHNRPRSYGQFRQGNNKSHVELTKRSGLREQMRPGAKRLMKMYSVGVCGENKKWKFIRKKKQRGRTSDRCFICQKKGHFARNCPDKRKSQALIQVLSQVEPVDLYDLESLYSLDDEPGDSILCTVAYSDFSSDDDSDPDSFDDDSDFGVHMVNPIPHVFPVQEEPPLPLAKVHLLTDVYAKPIPVIAFFDTGSSVSILNPSILPDHYWKPHHQNFMAASGENFVIDKISVPINIRLFPKCVIRKRLLGSSSHGKDLLIGFDVLHKLPSLRWTGEGLHYKSFFNPWTDMHRLFVATISPPVFNIANIKQRLIETSCASSHTEFLTKHPSPLWLNPSF
ncbi:reverse transcriptase domain, Viral movement protein [Artemisia annua]|uniref:Reverse transcriptase domain, Viral movement protein n=1 Tax=Artemisia annua TaxID=35608 RepID=A0A2U1MQI8_ARTAN|nr:reverse transcriptase domain, Viral movement protein [Artemisia annua]